MDWPKIIGLIGLVILCLLYLVPAISVSRLLIASDFFDPWQTRMQLLIIWLIPILGSAVVAAMLLPHIRIKRSRVPWLELLLFSAFVSSVNQYVYEAGSDQATIGDADDAP